MQLGHVLIRLRPKIRWTLALRDLVVLRFETTLQVRRDCIELVVFHVTPRRPRHRRREKVRMQREVSLPRRRRGDSDVRRILGPQAKAQRVEDLTLRESPEASL